MQARKKRIEEQKQRRDAARNEELLAKARVEFKAERIVTPPPQYPRKNIHAQFFRPGPAAKQSSSHGFEIKTPDRLVRALQVRTTRDPEWGNVKSVTVNVHTDPAYIAKLDKELSVHMSGWINNGHFGPDAQFRLATVPAPGSKRSY